MKNIYILPTDQPSRLWVNSLLQGKLELSEETLIGSLRNRYIYITSDEEIKQGDWYYSILSDMIFKAIEVKIDRIYFNRIHCSVPNKCKKIILTTDPTLIADGVQAIDDEFLEWFVKNSSCEFVEVESYKIDKEWDEKHTQFNPIYPMKNKYKLIIPQEEPKQYPLGSFAPGNYWHKECVTCKKEFMGDKRAVQCEPCAIKMTQEEPKQDLEKEMFELEQELDITKNKIIKI
jgi:hypothetical protein